MCIRDRKYIDNTCTDEERESVMNLLNTDAEFRKSYELIVDLEDQLLSVAKITMRPDFKTQLVQKVAIELREQKVSIKTNILPIKWIKMCIRDRTISSYVIDLQSYITIIYTKKNFKNVDKIFFQKDTTERIISIFTPSFNPGLSN